MKILAIDTSSSVASVAILQEDKLLCELTINDTLTHSERLMPMIDHMLGQVNLTPSDIDLFAVACGPGSFTGIRIGVSAAKGLSFGLDKPVVGVSTLEAMAYLLPHCRADIYPVLDARNQQVYSAGYRFEASGLKELSPPCALALDAVIDAVKARGHEAIFIGDGALVHRELLSRELGRLCLFAPASSNMQSASCVGVLAALQYSTGQDQNADRLIPIYLRKSQAERMKEAMDVT